MHDRDARLDDVRRYVAGTLTGAELDAFEAALFEDTALLAAVEEETALREGLREQAASADLALLAPHTSRPPPRWLPLAASFVIGAAGGAFAMLQSGGARNDVQANVPVLLLETARGAAPPARTFHVAADVQRLVLQIPVVANDPTARFDVVLRDERGADRLRLSDLHADGDEILTVIVPASALPPGPWRADIARRGGDGTSSVAFSIAR